MKYKNKCIFKRRNTLAIIKNDSLTFLSATTCNS